MLSTYVHNVWECINFEDHIFKSVSTSDGISFGVEDDVVSTISFDARRSLIQDYRVKM